MTGPLARLGLDWDDLADRMADWQADLLRRAAQELSHGIDLAAQRDVEGAGEWRDLIGNRRNRYANERA